MESPVLLSAAGRLWTGAFVRASWRWIEQNRERV